jgi:hypothetical protein
MQNRLGKINQKHPIWLTMTETVRTNVMHGKISHEGLCVCSRRWRELTDKWICPYTTNTMVRSHPWMWIDQARCRLVSDNQAPDIVVCTAVHMVVVAEKTWPMLFTESATQERRGGTNRRGRRPMLGSRDGRKLLWCWSNDTAAAPPRQYQ